MSNTFILSINEAVSTSVATNKPMVVFITDGSESSEHWGNSLLTENGNVVKLISLNAVAVKIVSPSQEFGFFSQIFPNAPVPSIYFIKTGQLLDIVLGDISAEQFKERVAKVVTATDETLSTLSENTPEIRPSDVSSGASASSEITSPTVSAEAVDSTSKKSSLSPSKNTPSKKHEQDFNKKKYHSIKEQIAEESAQRYKKEQLKKKRQEREEKERILRLLKADQLERKLINKQKQDKATSQDQLSKEENEKPLHSHANHNHPECVLSIRLLDGSRITHTFSSKDNLLKVRDWVDENRTDGDQPYVFYEAVIRKSYGIHEETITLAELNLPPRSALILKPESNYSTAYKIGSSDGLFSRVGSLFYSLLGYEADTSHSGSYVAVNDHDDEHHTNETNSRPHSITHKNSNNNMVPRAGDVAGSSHHQDTIRGAHHQDMNFDRHGSSSPFVRSRNVSNDDLNSFYSSSSHVTASITSLSDLNNSRNKDKNKKVTYNGNQTNLEDDADKNHKSD